LFVGHQEDVDGVVEVEAELNVATALLAIIVEAMMILEGRLLAISRVNALVDGVGRPRGEACGEFGGGSPGNA
jgi:hypothetical protein